MLVPNSRGWHENDGERVFCTSKHTLKWFTWQKPTEIQFWYSNSIAVILNKLNSWIVYLVENFKSLYTHLYFICLPAIRSTSGRRIGSVFFHNTEYRRVNTNLLFQLRFIHCAMESPFIIHCFPFSLTGERKFEKSLKRCQWIVWLILITSH